MNKTVDLVKVPEQTARALNVVQNVLKLTNTEIFEMNRLTQRPAPHQDIQWVWEAIGTFASEAGGDALMSALINGWEVASTPPLTSAERNAINADMVYGHLSFSYAGEETYNVYAGNAVLFCTKEKAVAEQFVTASKGIDRLQEEIDRLAGALDAIANATTDEVVPTLDGLTQEIIQIARHARREE